MASFIANDSHCLSSLESVAVACCNVCLSISWREWCNVRVREVWLMLARSAVSRTRGLSWLYGVCGMEMLGSRCCRMSNRALMDEHANLADWSIKPMGPRGLGPVVHATMEVVPGRGGCGLGKVVWFGVGSRMS
jgi:hypothetical protein